MTYLLRADVRHYPTVTVGRDEDTVYADFFDGRHSGEGWSSPAFHIYEKDRRLPTSDSPGCLPGVPLFSKKARESVEHLISPHGEFLRLACREQELYAFNVTTVVERFYSLCHPRFTNFQDHSVSTG